MKRVLIIKTGETVTGTDPAKGDFDDWIISGMNLERHHFEVASVYQGQSLPAHDEVMGIVVTGSAAMVTDRADWSEHAAAYLAAAVGLGIPTLGICYGHQLLAHALGGKVDFNPRGREIGTIEVQLTPEAREDRLMSGLDSPFPAHSSHSQSVIELPAEAVILASNPHEPYHAVRFAPSAWGLQFHPEFDEEVMTTYLRQRRATLGDEGLDAQALIQQVTETGDAWRLLRRFARIMATDQ